MTYCMYNIQQSMCKHEIQHWKNKTEQVYHTMLHKQHKTKHTIYNTESKELVAIEKPNTARAQLIFQLPALSLAFLPLLLSCCEVVFPSSASRTLCLLTFGGSSSQIASYVSKSSPAWLLSCSTSCSLEPSAWTVSEILVKTERQRSC